MGKGRERLEEKRDREGGKTGEEGKGVRGERAMERNGERKSG